MTSVRVELYVGEACFSRCVADVFDEDTLTITTVEGIEMQTYPPGTWRHATTYDEDGYPLATYCAVTAPKSLMTDETLAAFQEGFRR